MSSHNEKTTFGATVVKPSEPEDPSLLKPRPTLQLKPSIDSSILDSSTPASAEPSPSHEKSNPFSPFYSHPTTRRSLEQQNSKTRLDVYNVDVEKQMSGSQPASSISNMPKISVDGRVKECTVWPSKTTLQQKEKMYKRQGRNPWHRLNKKQKIMVQVLIFLLVVGAGVGIGVGISRAVGGRVNTASGTVAIPNSHD